MNKGNYTAKQRRALNMIWTAAGDYSFEPEYMAFLQNGTPDLYMNSIIGYVRRDYDPDVMAWLFSCFDQTLFEELYNGLLWIALEQAVYQREAPLRPALPELRLAYARQFFRDEKDKSRQQWMAQNSFVYTLQAAKWHTVLGEPDRLVLPWKKHIFRELMAFDASMDAETIRDRILRIYKTYFRFNAEGARRRIHLRIRGWLGNLLSRTPSGQVMRNDMIEIGMQSFGGGGAGFSDTKAGETVEENTEKDFAYIENCFGRPLYDAETSLQLEHKLCTGNHSGCHLYFTKGDPAGASSDPFYAKVASDASAQRKKNRAYYDAHHQIYETGILQLSAQVKNAMLVYLQPDTACGKSGRLCAQRVWRGVFLHDQRIFQESEESSHYNFSVDLMLDASASRMGYQETVAAQAYVIARSLQKCHIPVQVYSFCSLRGYTVMRLFCTAQDTADAARIFDYYAAGWNRDGLALRGAGHLMETDEETNHILIVLTDASPNDDRNIPPTAENGFVISRSYANDAAILDAQTEVRELKKKKIEVMAILNGDHCQLDDAQRIYGDNYVHIRKIEQFSDAVGKLLTRQILKHSS